MWCCIVDTTPCASVADTAGKQCTVVAVEVFVFSPSCRITRQAKPPSNGKPRLASKIQNGLEERLPRIPPRKPHLLYYSCRNNISAIPI